MRWFSVLATAMVGCGPAYVSDGGVLEFDGAGMRDPGDGTRPNPVLVGGAICSSPPEHIACFDETIHGGERIDETCLRADPDAAEVVWELTFRPDPSCAFQPGLVSDAVTYPVVDPAGVTVEVQPIEVAIGDYVRIDGGGALPPDWAWTPGEPVSVASTGRFAFDPRVVLAGRPVALAWQDAAYGLIDPVGTAAVEASDGRPVVSGSPGDAGTARLDALGGSWPVQPFAVVDGEDAASIEIVAVGTVDDDDRVSPLGARAVVRDAQGAPIYGAPVTWEVEGPLEVRSGIAEGLPGDDYAVFDEHDAGKGEASVIAHLGPLRDRVDLTWDPPAPWDLGDDIDLSPHLCSCATAPGAASLLPLALGLLLVRRRRSA